MKMSFLKIFSFAFFILNAFRLIPAVTFHVQNNCTHTVWAAAVPGGGQELRQGETWMVNVNSNSLHSGRIWPRTNCKFNQNGTGKCETGDCDGELDCTMSSSSARSPVTIAEYTLDGTHMDYFDISLINGFNIPLEFRAVPGSTGCAAGIKCATDINGLCPTELRHPGGCKHPCNVFRNQQFCCRDQENCDPTASYFKFFKDLCPNSFTYTFDEVNNTFTCLTGTNYTIVFCPLS